MKTLELSNDEYEMLKQLVSYAIDTDFVFDLETEEEQETFESLHDLLGISDKAILDDSDLQPEDSNADDGLISTSNEDGADYE